MLLAVRLFSVTNSALSVHKKLGFRARISGVSVSSKISCRSSVLRKSLIFYVLNADSGR